jgi:hypothetical protein
MSDDIVLAPGDRGISRMLTTSHLTLLLLIALLLLSLHLQLVELKLKK